MASTSVTSTLTLTNGPLTFYISLDMTCLSWAVKNLEFEAGFHLCMQKKKGEKKSYSCIFSTSLRIPLML